MTPPATSAAAAQGTRQQGREIIKTVLSDYLCNFRSEAVYECASILTLKAATLVKYKRTLVDTSQLKFGREGLIKIL